MCIINVFNTLYCIILVDLKLWNMLNDSCLISNLCDFYLYSHNGFIDNYILKNIRKKNIIKIIISLFFYHNEQKIL